MSTFFTPFDEDTAPTGVRGVAAQLSLHYVGTTRDHSYRAEVPRGIPALPLFADADLARSVSDLAYGEFAGYPVQLFNYDAVVYRDEPDRTRRTCVVFGVPARLPAFQIAPHNRLSAARQGRVDPRSFEARYRVVSRDASSMDAMLDPSMRTWLAGLDPLLRFEASGSDLLAHTGLLAPEDLPKLLTTVFTFVIRIPDDVMVRFGGVL